MPKYTKRHYEDIADAFYDRQELFYMKEEQSQNAENDELRRKYANMRTAVQLLISDFAVKFKKDNQMFDDQKFIKRAVFIPQEDSNGRDISGQ